MYDVLCSSCVHVMGGWHNFLIVIKYTLIMFAKLYDSDLLSVP